MKTKGWLINDCLTCISGTETLWHFLLNTIPNLSDKTYGYTPFYDIKSKIEKDAEINGCPDFIIRNASYFPVLNLKSKTISILQDFRSGDEQQLEVCNKSDIVVCVSEYLKEKYKEKVRSRIEIIPVGTDFSLFCELQNRDFLAKSLGIFPNSILFIGAANKYPKGFDLVMDIVNKTNYNFCFVMKDDWFEAHPRIKVFNKVTHEQLKKIINACKMLLCTSREETLHLAGVECAACNIPLVVSNVGIYYEMQSGAWGRLVKEYNSESFVKEINYVFDRPLLFRPRSDFLHKGLDLDSAREKWLEIIKQL